MAPEKILQVIELRNYLLKPNLTNKFAEYFANHFVDSQNIRGGYLLGKYVLPDQPDNFFWIRGFENMRERSRFLPEFYYGDVWKKFGNKANEMMIDSDDVYLLKPLDEKQSFNRNKFLSINFYFANEANPIELSELFQNEYRAFFEGTKEIKTSFWISEMSENDFPRLPVFQFENLFVVITTFENEDVYAGKLREFIAANPQFENDLKRKISKMERLKLYEI